MKRLLAAALFALFAIPFGALAQGSATKNLSINVASGGSCVGGIPCGLGWYDIPNTHFRGVEQTSWNHTTSLNPENVMIAWGGGAYDSNRNRLIIFGGGHGDYRGNEVYALDLNANPIAPVRLNEPDQYSPDGTCHSPFQPGTTRISSRHTYEGLAFLPTQDRMFIQGGSEIDSGCFGNDRWLFDPGAVSWPTNASTSGWANGIPICAPDPVHDQVLCFNNANGDLWRYDPIAATMTSQSPSHGSFPSLDMSGTVDSDGKRFYLVGGGFLGYFDISGSAPYPGRVDLTGTGCTSFKAGHYPGVQYDPALHLLVEWHGGNTVNTYNPATDTCSAFTNSNGPGAQLANGTHGRFQYVSSMGVYILCNGWDSDCFSLRLVSAGDANFAHRRTRPGVLNYEQLSDTGIYSTVVDEAARTDGFSVASHPNLTRDTSVFLSGGASANFFIPVGAGVNGPGANLWAFFGQVAATQTFGQNSTFYVQYAFRADGGWTSTDWTQYGGSGQNTAPKLSIFHNVIAGSCAEEEITVHNHNAHNLPTVYSECGSRQAITSTDGSTYNESGSFLYFQQGWTIAAPFTGYQCEYNSGAFSGPNCFHFTANQWYTIYFKIHVGTWGSSNSSIEAWIAPYGQQMKKWVNTNSYILNTENLCNASGTGSGSLPCPGFNTLELTQFMTGKISGNGSPAAHVWYQEVIISNQPIPSSCLSGCSQP